MMAPLFFNLRDYHGGVDTKSYFRLGLWLIAYLYFKAQEGCTKMRMLGANKKSDLLILSKPGKRKLCLGRFTSGLRVQVGGHNYSRNAHAANDEGKKVTFGVHVFRLLMRNGEIGKLDVMKPR
jgi:hypothetical protein